jgi:hypothetical protein
MILVNDWFIVEPMKNDAEPEEEDSPLIFVPTTPVELPDLAWYRVIKGNVKHLFVGSREYSTNPGDRVLLKSADIFETILPGTKEKIYLARPQWVIAYERDA